MSILKFFKKLHRNRKFLLYIFESTIALIYSKVLRYFTSFEGLKKNFGHYQCESISIIFQNESHVFKQIQRSIKLVVKYLPWKARCLDQALAVQWMLRRRNLDHTLYFGMVKNSVSSEQWLAHAWVRCGNCWVIGYEPHIPYTVVATYAWFSPIKK